MCLVISAISLIVHIYSVRYMVEEPGYGRFFTLLDLMTGSLMLMVVAGDLITLVIAWHLVGILLCFLDMDNLSIWWFTIDISRCIALSGIWQLVSFIHL